MSLSNSTTATPTPGSSSPTSSATTTSTAASSKHESLKPLQVFIPVAMAVSVVLILIAAAIWWAVFGLAKYKRRTPTFDRPHRHDEERGDDASGVELDLPKYEAKDSSGPPEYETARRAAEQEEVANALKPNEGSASESDSTPSMPVVEAQGDKDRPTEEILRQGDG